MKALEIAALGLQMDLERLKASAHNLANISSPGFKRQVAVQQPFFDLIETGAGLTLQPDARAGKFVATGRALDLAFPEGRFLSVERDDGTQAVTRQGGLRIDALGTLRTDDGAKVLGQRGVIQIREDERGGLEVDGSGQIKTNDRVIDALRLVRLAEGAVPQSLGGGLLSAETAQWDRDVPVTGVRSGHLEQSNVNTAQEMLTVMSSTRHAETMVRVFQAADEMQEKAIRRLGENG